MPLLIEVPKVPDSSESSEAGGNTKPPARKQISPAKRWCFTFNNYTEKDISSISSIFEEHCNLGLFSKEVGESGTPHLQGYCEFKKKLRPISITKHIPDCLKIHWEKCKGDRASNIDYCSKDGNIIWSKCLPKPIIDFYDKEQEKSWQLDIKNIIATEPDRRKVYWYYDEIGNNGKSTLVRHLLISNPMNILYLSKGKYADIAYIINNAQMDLVDTILIDLPRNNGNGVSYDAIEALKNGMILSTKYEGRMALFNPCHVIVFANERPDETKLSADRWVIIDINA